MPSGPRAVKLSLSALIVETVLGRASQLQQEHSVTSDVLSQRSLDASACLQWEAAHGSDSDTGWQDEFAGTQEFEGAFEVEAEDRDSGEGCLPLEPSSVLGVQLNFVVLVGCHPGGYLSDSCSPLGAPTSASHPTIRPVHQPSGQPSGSCLCTICFVTSPWCRLCRRRNSGWSRQAAAPTRH